MGAGNPTEDGFPLSRCDAQSELLKKAIAMDLGFSHLQLSSAIKHYFQVFESVEEACAWIPSENFSIIVDYILENPSLEEQCPPTVDSQTDGEVGFTHFSVGESEKPLELRNKRGLPIMLMNKKNPVGTLNPKIRKLNQSLDVCDDSFKKNVESSGSTMLPLDNKAFAPMNGFKTNHTREEVSEDRARMVDRLDRYCDRNVGSSYDTLVSSAIKQKVGVFDEIPRNFGRLDRDAMRSHYRQKMVPKISDDKPQSTLDGLKNQPNKAMLSAKVEPQSTFDGLKNQPDKGVLSANVEGESSSLALINHPNMRNSMLPSSKMQGHSGKYTVNSPLPPLRIEGALEKQKLHNKGLVCSAHKQGMRQSTPQAEGMKHHGCSHVNGDKHPLDRCMESLELRGSETSSDESKRFSNKPEGVTTTSYLFELEACLRKGDCEKALSVFQWWKKEGFKVECEQASKDDFVSVGGDHELLPDIPGKKRGFVVSYDISRGLEKLPISCVNEYNTNILPDDFLYITKSVIRQTAHVDTSLSRIGDLHCSCSGDCLRLPGPGSCKCTDSTRGEYAYDQSGRLIERLATNYPSGWGTRKGDFITECCNKCSCTLNCGNRVVQRGITKKLQVFMTPTKKGWGVRALEKIPARCFVFEYVGEVATNLEQYDRNMEYEKNGVYTYTMNLDADLDMERKHFGDGLTDTELLVLDATMFGNVSRFVNHRCYDPNLFMRPVQIETRDTHYYHAAFFAVRDIEEMEELTWDYGIDFDDDTHQVKAFTCRCKSQFCRDTSKKRKASKSAGSKNNRMTAHTARLKIDG